ncbi:MULTISPECIES: sn-glycerol-1-phosphate dehydrogenase [Clostridia]|uniref:sn-glycerol-1-phosphate dehydrogenase n=2 Tax=Clostridia TaxID=186801 RepID=A0A8I0DKL9_9CLOT|nr:MULTISPECIES: sn-glycerol-1-phosphate dehydrogenase [Clostridia]MBC5639233.1 sn-glycerol-1-phosphate dehydrogenase [Clostridium lentum]MBC5653326.1 sn-glycerol-1-phosphate dehydrogenase [Blautia lenta]
MRVDINKFIGFCGCGKEHKIMVKDIIIESEAIKKLSMIMEKEGFKNITIICDENTYAAAGEEIKEIIPKGKFINLKSENLHANEIAVQKVYECLSVENDVLIALGSGTIHDITRYVAYNKDIPFISVPTAASVDGFVSTVAAMTWKGDKKTFTAVSPIYVVADTDIFKEAPYRLTASGVSDLIGKYTALVDWKISSIVIGEYICNKVCNMEIDAVNKLCECVDDLVLGKLEAYEQLMYALILSGLAMQIIGNSRPASGAEHHMSHLWEMEVINKHLDAYHGEKVSVGLILVMEEYKKIKKSIENGRCRVKKYYGLEEDMLKEVFKSREMYDSIMKENTPDPLLNVNKVILQNRLESIAEILEKLPTLDFVKNTLKRAKAVTTLEEIGLSNDVKQNSIRVLPYVRNRLTLMRISKMLEY